MDRGLFPFMLNQDALRRNPLMIAFAEVSRMPDARLMYDHETLRACHLEGKEHTLQIERVEQGAFKNKAGKVRMPVVYFKGKKLGFGVNKTNMKTIHELYGSWNTDDWAGKWVTLYVTQTYSQEEKGNVDCIRIRNRIPNVAQGAT